MTDPASFVRAAATVILFRDRIGAPAELLMMERAQSMAFAAGALVFPGGAVDDRDHHVAAALDHEMPIDEAAARVAAVRETLEECGIALGFPRDFPSPRLSAMRSALIGGAAFSELLTAEGVALDLTALVPFARWQPDADLAPKRRFDARFYLARSPEGQDASADMTENMRLFWRSARDTLADCDAGKGRIIFPTRRNLERLATLTDFSAAVAHAARFPVEKVTPWIEERDGAPHLCIPDHLGYPVTSEPLELARRG